jgi:hypothetical protein
MPELVPALPHLAVGRQEAIHRARGAEVLPFVEQRGVDFGRREIHESFLVEHGEHCGLLFGAERPGRRPMLQPDARAPLPPVVGGSWQPERRARRRDAEPGPDLGHRGQATPPLFFGLQPEPRPARRGTSTA